MTLLVTLNVDKDSVAAYGHPSDCSEPAPGSVSQYQSETNSVTVNNANGVEERFATLADANLKIPSHAHDYSDLEGCHDNADHTILPDSSKVSSSLNINGSPIFLEGPAVTTDPKSGGDVEISDGAVNSSVSQ